MDWLTKETLEETLKKIMKEIRKEEKIEIGCMTIIGEKNEFGSVYPKKFYREENWFGAETEDYINKLEELNYWG